MIQANYLIFLKEFIKIDIKVSLTTGDGGAEQDITNLNLNQRPSGYEPGARTFGAAIKYYKIF